MNDGEWVSGRLSLGGTVRNCAGGPTPWRTWLTCEESIVQPGADQPFSRSHGYIFEVPLDGAPTGDRPSPWGGSCTRLWQSIRQAGSFTRLKMPDGPVCIASCRRIASAWRMAAHSKCWPWPVSRGSIRGSRSPWA